MRRFLHVIIDIACGMLVFHAGIMVSYELALFALTVQAFVDEYWK